MSHINIVLYQPEIPQNTGNIARTCAATGASLHLIRPLGFAIDDKKLKRAGLDYWHQLDITYYDNMEDFFSKNPEADFYCFSTKAKHRYTDVAYPEKTYLFFGPESRGLPEEFLHEKSNIRKFMSDYDIFISDYYPETNRSALWRIFDCSEETPIDEMPETSFIMRAYKDYIKNGGKLGYGVGVFAT